MGAINIERERLLFKGALIQQRCEAWKKAALKLKEAEEREEIARKELIEACGEENFEGNGVKVWEVERKGSIDYTLVPELRGVNLESYRKKGTFYWTVKASLKD